MVLFRYLTCDSIKYDDSLKGGGETFPENCQSMCAAGLLLCALPAATGSD